MLSIQCALCGKKQKIKEIYKEIFFSNQIDAKIFSARRSPDRLHYRFVKCLNCGLIFSNPIMERVKVENLYRQSRFNYENESKYLRKIYFNYFKKFINQSNKDIRILEIGCANGFFLDELNKNGFRNIFGVEPGRNSVNKASKYLKRKIKKDVFRKELFNKNSFDVILCFHTLDHVVDPNTFLQEVNLLLKDNGRIFFVVHNTNALSAKLLGEKSPIFDIEHIFLFNKENLKKIFMKNHFNEAFVFNIINKYHLSYWVKLFPLPIFIKNLLLKILDFSKLGRIPISLPAGNIGIVAGKNPN